MADKKDDIVLSIRGMSKSFGRNRVLDHINLDVRRGTVMGLMGENGAGKSTMMKCLFGTYQKDEGNIFLDGREVSFSGPKDALENGIAMVHQELNQCLERNVIDNLFLGRYPVNSMGVVDEGRMKKEASELFRKLGMTVNLTQPMRNMSVSQRQMCEIAKAISYNSQVIVLDEPTSSLTVQEVDKLFEMMRMLKEQGIALIYISHKMDEVYTITDKITILRDGESIATWNTQEATHDMVVKAMVGRELTEQYPKRESKIGEPILELKHLTREGEFEDISLTLHRGEILGLVGLVGAGRTETVQALFGVTKIESGEVFLNGKKVEIKKPIDAIKNGIAYVTEDRKGEGLVLPMSIAHNTTLPSMQELSNKVFIKSLEEKTKTEKILSELKVKMASSKLAVKNLSGGNQQKAIIAREIGDDPEFLIAVQPTRGLDVGAIEYIHKQLIAQRDNGKAVLLISLELDEVLKVSDRILVIYEGELVADIDPKNADINQLGLYMAGSKRDEVAYE